MPKFVRNGNQSQIDSCNLYVRKWCVSYRRNSRSLSPFLISILLLVPFLCRFEIIGKKVMPFKVCSCPKRDMQREDTSIVPRKREAKDVPHGKRPSKMVCPAAEIKIEPPTPSPVKNCEQPFPDNQPSHTVTLTMPNRESMKHVLRCAFNEVTGSMARGSQNYEVFADKIQGLLNSL